MDESELANTAWWAHFWSEVEHWAFLSVVVALAIEFGAMKFAAPHKAKLDDARATEIAMLTTEGDRLRNSAAQAALETEKLKSRLAWRTISTDGSSELLSRLSKSRGTVTLAYVQNDPEALNFANGLGDLFANANKVAGAERWIVTADPRMYSDRNIFDIFIFGQTGDALTAVRNAFIAAQVPFLFDVVPPATVRIGAMTTTGGSPTTDVVIMVGSKRPNF